jgi:TonB family protein
MLMRLKSKLVDGMMIALMLLVAAACHHASEPTATGRSSFAFVDASNAAASSATATAVEPKSGDYFTEARSTQILATAIYPAKALAAKLGMTTVGVRVTIDKNGRVSDIGPSLLAVSIPTKFDADFQEAVRAAVVQWRFFPAQTFHVDVTRDATGELQISETKRENAETYFDLAFTFTASGAVLGGMTGK